MSDELSRGEITLVLEWGTHTTKVGYADQPFPSLIKTTEDIQEQQQNGYDTVTSVNNKHVNGHSSKESSLLNSGLKDLLNNNTGGVPFDYKSLSNYWKNILMKEFTLRKPLKDTPLLLNIPYAQSHRVHIEKLSQILFEDLQVPAAYLAQAPLMTLYACGVVNGIVIDIGHTKTSIIPILDSNIEYQASLLLPIAGQTIDQSFSHYLNNNDDQFKQSLSSLKSSYDNKSPMDLIDEKLAHKIKEKLGILHAFPQNPSEIIKINLSDVIPNLPSPSEISIGSSRFDCLNCLFSPSQSPSHLPSVDLAYQIFQCLKYFEREKRTLLLDHMVLIGGSSQIPGLQKRLEVELARFLSMSDFSADGQPKSLRFLKLPDYFGPDIKGRNEHASWFGASMVAKLVFTDARNFISRSDYNEHGPRITSEKPC